MKYPLLVLVLCSSLFLAGGSGQAENPGHYFIEYIENTALVNTTKQVNPRPEGDLPAQGVPLIDPESGHRITRVSDVGQIENWSASYPPEGNPARGVTNGYSKYTCVNVTGEYAIAWASQDKRNGLYRLADGAYVSSLESSVMGLGESNDVRWDLSGRTGTEYDLIYCEGNGLYRQDALVGISSEALIHDFGVSIKHEGHMDQDANGRYRAVRLENDTTAVIDLIDEQVLPVTLHSGTTDISPTGRWLYLSGTSPIRFYDIEALVQGDTTTFVSLPTTNHGHDGWAYDKDGDEVYLFQDNRTDHFSSFNPKTSERIDIFSMSETGWGLNQHLSRMINPQKKGWILMSTYCRDYSSWAYNQLMMIEILPKDQHPRVWHLTTTYNHRWENGLDIGGYFSEAFAGLSPDGNSVFWGSNWMASDNLELYRVELPEDWQDYLDQHTDNNAPVIAGLSDQSVTAGSTISFQIGGSDPDGDALQILTGNMPTGASITAGFPATFSWSPGDDDHGPHRVTFRLTDGVYSCSKAVIISVLDSSAPTAPDGLAAMALSDSQIELTWQAGDDEHSGVPGYNVYRDGERIGTSALTRFIDSGLKEKTAYSYTIRSVNGADMESSDSGQATATTLNNTIAPMIVAIETSGDSDRMEIIFDEPLDPASAQEKSNYRIDPTVTVEKAILQPSGKSVYLKTSAHDFGRQYKLTVVGVKDRAIIPNATNTGTYRHYVLSDLAPSNYLIEHVEYTTADQTNKQIFPVSTDPLPAQGVPFIQDLPGHRITRISDVSQIENQTISYDGDPAQGMTNGYSKYTNVNVTGEYAIAWAAQNGRNGLYRLTGNEYICRLTSSAGWLGEISDARWDLSGRPGTEYNIIYHVGSRLISQNVLEGVPSETELYDFGFNLIHEGHMDQDAQGRYRAVRLENATTVVFDLREKRVLPPVLHSGTTDVSPSGKWLYLSGTTPARFYDIDALAVGDTTRYAELPTGNHGHDGWAFDTEGNEVYLFQDNNNDWFSAFNPASAQRIDILNMKETGWSINQHMGRVMNPRKKGWMLMSTYCNADDVWAYNQLLMIEILPYQQSPRIWRIASTYNHRWIANEDVGGYFAEAFASIDKAGNNIYWGGNWLGRDNLELYRVELPQNWHEVLGDGSPLNTTNICYDWTRFN